jgi:multidrug efflux pump subunit AcrA (membrane-fusion protein)
VVTRRAFSATVSALGAVRPQIGAEVRVGSRISGQVRRLRANIGDRVTRGAVIAELETRDLDAAVAERAAEREVAAAALAELESAAPRDLARADAEVAREEASARLARLAWERQQQLLRERASSAADADLARERHEVAQAALEAVRQARDRLKSGLGERLRQAGAERDRATAAWENARVARSFAVITAPIGGVVAEVATQEGETVAAGLNAPTFVTIVDLARLQVNTFVDEVDIGKVGTGMPVSFTVDAFPSREFAGKVAAIYPSATIQDNVVKYVVAVAIEGEYAGLLRPEMTASVRIALPERTALALPARAIRREGGRSVVYRLEDRTPVASPVQVGWRDGPWIEIVSGLSEGDTVLLNPELRP